MTRSFRSHHRRVKRWRFSAACVVALTLAAPAFAEPAAKPESSEITWLKKTSSSAVKKASAASAPDSISLRAALAVLVVGVLGLVALHARRRRRARLPAAASDLSVLASTRVGSKAHAVILRVGGRTVLLGVTDASVRRLAWLDDEADESLADSGVDRLALHGVRELAAPALRLAPGAGEEISERAPETKARTTTSKGKALEAADSSLKTRFGELLKSAIGKGAETSAAEELASETADVVATRGRTAKAHSKAETRVVALAPLEGQAAGLISRRQKAVGDGA